MTSSQPQPEFQVQLRTRAIITIQIGGTYLIDVEGQYTPALALVKKARRTGRGRVILTIWWLYRLEELVCKPPKDPLTCTSELHQEGGRPAIQDISCQEVFLSVHCQELDAQSILWPVTVRMLPSMDAASLSSVLSPLSDAPVSPPAGGGPKGRGRGKAPGSPPAGPRPPLLLPGFVCRRFYDTQTGKLMPLAVALPRLEDPEQAALVKRLIPASME